MKFVFKTGILITALFVIFGVCYAENDFPIRVNTNSVGNVFYVFDTVQIKTVVEAKINHPEYAQLKTSLYNFQNKLISENSIQSQRDSIYSKNDSPNLLFIEEFIDLPVGYYTYKVSFQDKNKSAESFIKLSVIKKSRMKNIEESPYAVDAFLSWRFDNPDDVKTASELIKKAGISYVRDRMSWNQIEKEKGKFDFGRYDQNATIQSESGLKILQVFHDTALWASSQNDKPENIRQKYPPEDLRDIYDFFYKVASTFQGRVTSCEIWNEFDIPIFFLGKAEEYAAILKASYLAIKDADPSAKVLFGSTTLGSGELVWGGETFYDDEADIYIEKVFENGAIHYFDIFNIHNYGPVEGLTDKILRNKKILCKYCQSEEKFANHKDIWLTEMGSTSTKKMTEEIVGSEISQAEYLVKAYILGISGGLKKFFYFCFPNFVEHNKSFWGIFQRDDDGWQPKPAYSALANLVHTLSDKEFIGKVELDDKKNIETFAFKKNRKLTLVAWTKTGADAELNLSFKKYQKITLRNIFGAEERIKTNKQTKTFSLKITPSPVFIIGINEKHLINKIIPVDAEDCFVEKTPHTPADSIMKKLVIDLRCDKEDLLPGEFIKIYANLYNFSNQPINGIFELSYPEEFVLAEGIRDITISIEPKERIRKIFHLISQKSIREGEYTIKGDFLIGDSNKETAPSIRYVKIAEPVKILRTKVIPHNQNIADIEIRIRGNSSRETSGKICLIPPAGWEVLDGYKDGIAFSGIKKHQVMVGVIKIRKTEQWNKTSDNQFKIIAEVNGRQYIKTDYLETDAIHKGSLRVTIDVDLSDWKDASPFQMSNYDNYVIGKESVKSADDLKGEFYWKWDEKNLYFAANIIDGDIKNDYYTENLWTGDAIELFLDMRSPTALGNSCYDENVYQIFIVPSTDRTQWTKSDIKPYFKVLQPADKEFIGVETAFRKTESGYVIEAKMPSMNFGYETFSDNTQIGMEVTLDDIDSGDVQHRQMVWRGSPENWRNPAYFQRMILVK